MIQQRKAQLQDESELEKIRKKRHLDFLDILLFAKVSATGLDVEESKCGGSKGRIG